MIPIRDINPTERFSIVTALLIVVNIAVFLYQLTLGQEGESRFLQSFAVIPRHFFSSEPSPVSWLPASATLVTSMFLHGGLLHLGSNMLYLWIFGNNVEDVMGRLRFFVFYLVCGCAAAYAYAFFHDSSPVPMIGASGAVSGVLGAYLLLFPRARVVTLFIFFFYIRTVSIPAMTVLGLWFLLQFVNVLVADTTIGGVAWHAHIAGFVTGLLLVGLFKKRDVPFGNIRGRLRYP